MTENERAARYSDLFANGEGHDHAPDCAYCPVCATISVLRNTNPEVMEHLAAAARELIVAAGIILQEAEKVVGAPPRDDDGDDDGGRSRVRRIDLG